MPLHKLEEARKEAQKRAGRLVEEVTAAPAPVREICRGRRELSRVQRAGFGVESSASADPPRGSDEASTADVGPSAPAMDEGRRVQGAVPADTQRKRFGDLTARRAENEYVDDEMKRRGFVLQAGQWVGGQMLPGEPRDANLAEDFLREKFRREQAEGRAEASQDWGRGRRLGD